MMRQKSARQKPDAAPDLKKKHTSLRLNFLTLVAAFHHEAGCGFSRLINPAAVAPQIALAA